MAQGGTTFNGEAIHDNFLKAVNVKTQKSFAMVVAISTLDFLVPKNFDNINRYTEILLHLVDFMEFPKI